MLEPDALETGIAVVHRSHDGVEDFYAVQLLARKESQTVYFMIRNGSELAATYRVNGKQFTLNPNYGRKHGRCSTPDLLFEGRARGRFEPKNDECFIVEKDGSVTRREPGGCV
jgi:hypothetical protein